MFVLQATEAEPVMTANDEGLYVAQGMSRSLAEQLIEKSQESYIHKWAPSDSDVHFTSTKQIRWWNRVSAGKPLIMSAGTAAGELAAFAYITNVGQVNKKEGRTLEVRVYEGFREQEVGTMLGRLILDKYSEQYSGRTRVQMTSNNQAAFSLAVDLGYRTNDIKDGYIELVR